MLDKIFSIKNEYKNSKKYKIINFLGLKIKMSIDNKKNKITKNYHEHSLNMPEFGHNVIFRYKTLFNGKGKIKLNDSVMLGWHDSPYYYSSYGYIEARNSDSLVEIGDSTIINNNFSIIANSKMIKIGKNCRIGTNFTCINSDFHGLTIETRDKQEFIIDKDINIGDNVFIGNNVTILKGVFLGNGCVVGAGSVVTKSFEENCIVSGNPAKLIKRVDNASQTLVAVERERE